MDSEITVVSGGGKKVNAHYNGMVIETDQSVASGGEGSAPEPFTLFLASIGTCAGIYVYSFCQARDIPTDGIRIVEHIERREDGHGVGKISLTIEVPPSFPEKYHSAIVRAADLCAVKKHILDPPEFEVTSQVTAAA